MTALAYRTTSPLVDELIAHAVGSVEAADHFHAPFPHIVIRDFFPAAVYRDILRNIPREGYEPITASRTRMALRLYGDHVKKLEPDIRGLWSAISDTLTSTRLTHAIRVKLHDGLKIRARGDNVGDPDDLTLVPQPVLYSDTDGYQIKPHPDTRKKVVTMQLYCPEDASQEALGTTLYQASLKGLMHPGSYCLEPVKMIPFLPNLGYAFVVLKAYHSVTNMSWHGRPAIKTDQPRISILNTFYCNEQAGF